MLNFGTDERCCDLILFTNTVDIKISEMSL